MRALMDSLPAPPASAASKKKVFLTRLFSTLLLWSVMTFGIVSGNNAIVLAITAFFGIGGAYEYQHLLAGDAKARPFRFLVLFVALGWWAVVLHHALIAPAGLAGEMFPPMWLDVAAMCAVMFGAFTLVLRSALDGEATLRRVATAILGVAYTVVLFAFIVRVIFFRAGSSNELSGLHLMLFLVMITKFCDMGAYAFGVMWGKHKMIPHISPAKSWEGFVGGFAGGFLGAAILLSTIPQHLAPLTWTHGLILVPILCIVGVIGDLAESVIKRCTHIKDTGHSLPGIGGILDLTDSLLFTAPVFYLYLTMLAR